MYRVYFEYTDKSRTPKRGNWLYAHTEVKNQQACLEQATKDLAAKYKWFKITKIVSLDDLLK